MDRTRTALAVTLGVMLLRLPAGWGIALLLPNPEKDPAVFYAALMLQECLLWGIPALVLRPWRSRRLVIQRKSLGLCAAAVTVGMFAQLAMMTVTVHWVSWTGAQQSAVLMPRNGVEWVLAVLALVVIPALTEEAFFRGGLLTALCDSMGALPAGILTAVTFALMHGSLAGLPAHLVISALCTLAMLSRGRLRAPVIMHMCYNGAALLFRSAQPEMIPALPLALILAAAVMWMCGEIRWRGYLRRLGGADIAMVCVILAGAAAMYLPQIF